VKTTEDKLQVIYQPCFLFCATCANSNVSDMCI